MSLKLQFHFIVFRIFDIAVSSFRLSIMLSAIDFNMPLLTLHMEGLENYSPVLVGAMFTVLAVGYCISNPFIGFCTRTRVSESACFSKLTVIFSCLTQGFI